MTTIGADYVKKDVTLRGGNYVRLQVRLLRGLKRAVVARGLD